jgi:hypothetical protein
MKNTKRVLSVVLAVVMAFSALSLVAFAHSATGAEVDGTASIKYEVTQVASADDIINGGTYTAVNNDIYAVSVLVKAPADIGIYYLAIPIQFDNSKFEPLMCIDSGDTYSGYKGFYADTDVYSISMYSLPARFADTNMYKADGSVTTSSMSAKVFGLANTKAGATTYTVQFEDTGVPGANKFTAGLAANVGVVYFAIDSTGGVNKTAYLNTVGGLLNTTDYLEMITFYFRRAEGVSEADCYGSEFGVLDFDTNAFGLQMTSQTATSGGFVLGAANPKAQLNIINGAVETPVKALATLTANGAKSQQIMFHLDAAATSPYALADVTSVDYRFVAQFSNTAFPIDYDTSNGKINSTDIAEVGFVMARKDQATADDLTDLSAADVVGLSKDSGTIRKCWTERLSTDAAGSSAFAFSCRIKDIPVVYDTTTSAYVFGEISGTTASEYIVAPYVITKSGEISFGTVQTSSVLGRCNTYAQTFINSQNA